MKIAIGCDEAGFSMKQEILAFFQTRNDIQVRDVGCYDTQPVLYPDVAAEAARLIQQHEVERAILICGTGIGMALSANKFRGVRAAVCHDIYSTERSILSNSVQVLCLGARVIASQLSTTLIVRWLELEFIPGSSSAKIERIHSIERGSGS